MNATRVEQECPARLIGTAVPVFFCLSQRVDPHPDSLGGHRGEQRWEGVHRGGQEGHYTGIYT